MPSAAACEQSHYWHMVEKMLFTACQESNGIQYETNSGNIN